MTAYSRLQISRLVWRCNGQRRASSHPISAIALTDSLVIPASTAELWRSARRLSR